MFYWLLLSRTRSLRALFLFARQASAQAPWRRRLARWAALRSRTQSQAAAIADSYYELAQRDVERRMVTTLRNAGVEVRRMTKEDYLVWLQLAQQTAWFEYTKINPRSQELLMTMVRTFLDSMGDAK